MGGSLEKEVDIGGYVSELPPVAVVSGGVGTCVHSTTQHYLRICAELGSKITDTAVAIERAIAHSTL